MLTEPSYQNWIWHVKTFTTLFHYNTLKKKNSSGELRCQEVGRASEHLPLGWREQCVEIHTVNFCSKDHDRNVPGKLKKITDPLTEAACHCKLYKTGKKLWVPSVWQRENLPSNMHFYWEIWTYRSQEKAFTLPRAGTDLGSSVKYKRRSRIRKSLVGIPSLQLKPIEAIPDYISQEPMRNAASRFREGLQGERSCQLNFVTISSGHELPWTESGEQTRTPADMSTGAGHQHCWQTEVEDSGGRGRDVA